MAITTFAFLALSAAPYAQAPAHPNEPGPFEKSAKEITPDNPIPRRTQSLGPEYPAAAAAVAASGSVTLRVTLDQGGRVAEVRLVAMTARGQSPEFSVNFTNAGVQNRDNLLSMQLAKPDAALAAGAIDALVQAAIDSVKSWVYEPPADGPISFSVGFRFSPDMRAGTTEPAAPGGLLRKDNAVRVSGRITPPAKIHDARPVYPPLAQSARVQGIVIMEGRIEQDGTVSHAQVMRSIPLLDQAALDAVLQWRFTPTLVDGQPVPVVMTVTVNFTLR
jgi:protein TonB